MKDKPLILLVDDQKQNMELLEAFLCPSGYAVTMASGGEEAINASTSSCLIYGCLAWMDLRFAGESKRIQRIVSFL